MARKATESRVMLLNPNTGRPDRTIDAEKYAAVKQAILKAVPRGPQKTIAFGDLAAAAKKHLPGGSIPGGGALNWYVTTVKLDMEARGLLVCDRTRSPQTMYRT